MKDVLKADLEGNHSSHIFAALCLFRSKLPFGSRFGFNGAQGALIAQVCR